MSTRITGQLNGIASARVRLDAFDAQPFALARWQSTTTATDSSITATSHSFSSALTSTMGGEIMTLPIEPLATDSVLDFIATIHFSSTSATWILAAFAGTSSSPFAVGSMTGEADTSRLYQLNLQNRLSLGSTATTDIAVRAMGTSSGGTFYLNTPVGGGNLSGQLNSNMMVLERQA